MDSNRPHKEPWWPYGSINLGYSIVAWRQRNLLENNWFKFLSIGGNTKEEEEGEKMNKSEDRPERMLDYFPDDHNSNYAIELEYTRLAQSIVEQIPAGPERTVALRKLLESKDCILRCV